MLPFPRVLKILYGNEMKTIFIFLTLSIIISCRNGGNYSTRDLIEALEKDEFAKAEEIIHSGVECSFKDNDWGPIHIATFNRAQ